MTLNKMQQSQVYTAMQPAVLQVVNQQPLQHNKKAIRQTGYVQLFCAITCIVMEIIFLVSMTNTNNGNVYGCFFPLGTGIWTGLVYLPAGVLGLSAGKRNNRCLVISYMVMSIISSCFAVTGVSMSILGSVQTWECRWYDSTSKTYTYVSQLSPLSMRLPSTIHSICQIIELVTSIVASVYCCHAVCSCCRDTPQQPVYIMPAQGQASNVVIVPSQQQQQPGSAYPGVHQQQQQQQQPGPDYPGVHQQQQQQSGPAYPGGYQQQQQYYPGGMSQQIAYNPNHPPGGAFTPEAPQSAAGYSGYPVYNQNISAPDYKDDSAQPPPYSEKKQPLVSNLPTTE